MISQVEELSDSVEGIFLPSFHSTSLANPTPSPRISETCQSLYVLPEYVTDFLDTQFNYPELDVSPASFSLMATSAPGKDHHWLLPHPSIDHRCYSEFSADLVLENRAPINRVYSSSNLNLTGRTGFLGDPHFHGTASGSGRPAILSVDDSNCTNSACTTPTSPVDSDKLSSEYDCDASDFPEPPPFGSPLIQRLRSSPWFLDGTNHIPDRCEKTLHMYLDHLSDRLGPTPRPLGTDKKCNLKVDTKLPSTPTKVHNTAHLLGKRDSHPFDVNERGLGIYGSCLRDGENSSPRDRKTTSGQDSSCLRRLPRIVRKMTSMRSVSYQANEFGHAYAHGSVPKVRSFQLRAAEDSTASKISMDRELWNQCKQHPSWMGKQSFATREIDAEKVRTLRQTSDNKAAVSESRIPSSKSLDPLLSHGASWKNNFNRSFIDISPDRYASKKGKTKSLLSKANEIFSWRRFRRKKR